MAAASRTARASCARCRGIRARCARTGHRRAPVRLRLRALPAGRRWRRRAGAADRRHYRLRLRRRRHGPGHRSGASRALSRLLREPGHPRWSTSPPAAPTTTRTSSARRSSRRPTATCRRKIRWSAWRARSTSTRAAQAALPGAGGRRLGLPYLQEWLPHVAQARARRAGADFVGLGRMVLSYPELPADVLAGRPLQRKRICRTFSDCTTAPRKGWSRAATRWTNSTRRARKASAWWN